MKPILVAYATREGHTKKIAEFLANRIRIRDVPATVIEAHRRDFDRLLGHFSAIVVAGSVHAGKHERELHSFVRRNLAQLTGMVTAFVSVSLSEAGAQDSGASPRKRAQASADVQRMIGDFLRDTHWNPRIVQPVAGALLFTRYNFVIRFIMNSISRRAGGSTDTSRDHVYTKSEDLDSLAQTLVEEVAGAGGADVDANKARGTFGQPVTNLKPPPASETSAPIRNFLSLPRPRCIRCEPRLP